MRKAKNFTLALLMAFSLAACSSDGAKASATTTTPTTPANSTANVEPVEVTTVEAGKLHMSTNAQFPPYEMIADDGSFEGIDIEIAEKIAESLGLELVVDNMEFDAALLAAQNGQSDIVMAGVTITDERKEVMDFTTTYASGVQKIIVRNDSTITSVDNLDKAEKIGTQRGTTGYLYCVSDYGEDRVTSFNNGALAIQALMNNQVDAVVIDNMPAREFIKANPGLKILETAYADEDYAIGLQKGNEALLKAINGVLAQLKADGTLQSIIDKYITSEIEQ